jgi:methylated-DNA-[protein]-cysteine S-methyltransferase
MPFVRRLETPLGPLWLASDGQAIVEVRFAELSGLPGNAPCLDRAAGQFEEYFAGERTEFDLPLRPAGTEFQRRVWDLLREIPFGRTASYGDLARRLGDRKLTRAVGSANGRNPISILIPCHRVVGVQGELTGYAGGLERKRALLELEQRLRQPALGL